MVWFVNLAHRLNAEGWTYEFGKHRCWACQVYLSRLVFPVFQGDRVLIIAWNISSGDTLGTRISVPEQKCRVPEWRLGWGLLIINQQIKYVSLTLPRNLSVIISRSLIMYKKFMINLSPRCCVLNSPKCSAPILSEIVNESCRHCDQRTQKLINNFCGQSLFRVVRCPLNGG